MKNMEKEIARIAEEILGIETLEMRNKYSLDCYECVVCDIKEALEEAYKAGMAAGTDTKGDN